MKLAHLIIGAALVSAVTPHAFAVKATGGNTTNVIDGYRIHTFTNSATASNFVVTSGGNVEMLVVAGGGGGGTTMGGGGGAGGLVYTSSYPVAVGDYDVAVGVGGLGGYAYNTAGQTGTKGSNSLFGVDMIAYGGGGGCGWDNHPSTSGGSGGGGNGQNAYSTGVAGQGHRGGSGVSSPSPRSGGGGGGAGTAGTNGTVGVGGNGGAGSLFWGRYYAGGGGGGIDGTPQMSNGGGDGGLGGGGAGSKGTIKAIDADPNTGGGGGGAGYSTSGTGRIGGNGASGIVIVRYPFGINNADGATNVTATSAWLNGNLPNDVPNAEVFVYWGPFDGEVDVSAWANTNTWAAPQMPGRFTVQAADLSSGSTYYYRYAVSNETGWTWAPEASVFITGDVWIDKLSDASEIGPTPGTFTVHRAATATNGALIVTYTVGGTAGNGTDYAALSGYLTIPAGETNAVIEVAPIFDHFLEGTETVVVTLVQGPYVIGLSSNATVEIEDAGQVVRTWGGGGANLLASNPDNWVEEEAPIAGDAIMLSNTNSKNMTWDMDLPIQSWTQDGYVGTVTMATVYSGQGAFTNFTILGDCVISNGTWTHAANPTTVTNLNNELYRLRVTIGGNLIVGSNAAVNVSEKGYAAGRGPGSSSPGNSGGSYGGRGAMYTPVPGPCYGSVTSPTNLGSGGGTASGGGAVLLTVGGVFHHDGQVLANGRSASYHTGAGGSIYVIAGVLDGTGTFSANGGIDTGNHGPGGGGRVALVVTNTGIDFAAYSGTCEALGRARGTKSASGTIYLEKYGDVPGRGELIVKGTGSASYDWRTDLNGIDAVTYAFSRITLTNAGVLGLLANNTLILTNTDLCVDTANSTEGITLMGGTLIVPDEFVFSNVFIRVGASNSTFSPASRLTVGTNGVFEVDQSHVMACDIVIEQGGILTHSANGDTESYKMDLALDGNLTVNDGGRVDVTGKGYAAARGPGFPPLSYAGGGSYGGRGQPHNTSLIAPCYGSVTAPVNLGSGGSSSAGGGAIRLTVSGAVVNNGQMVADGINSANHTGSGGSLFVRAGSLTGNGSFCANGGNYTATTGAGGGGRVALIVTNAGADFSSCTGAISAYGGYKVTTSGGGAGTVYLCEADQGLTDGTLIVDNDTRAGLYTEINSSVTDTTVGDVLIQRNGYLLLNTNQTLTVSGVWSNSASFTGLTDSMVIFTGEAGSTSTLYGATLFNGLVCTTGGKTLVFEADSTNSVEAQGRLWLRGESAAALVTLRSTSVGVDWKLHAAPTADQSVEYVDVQDSDARGGVEILALNSANSGRNENWKFALAFPGQINTWTGGSNTIWSMRGNWDLDRSPNETDVIVIPGSAPRYPVLDADRTVNSLEVQAGASLELADRNLTVTNNLIVAGSLVASGTETVTLLKDADFTGGLFDSARSTLSIAGGTAQTNNLGGATFYKIQIENSAAAVRLSGGFTATELRCEAPSGTRDLRFEAGKTVTLRDLVLRGAVGVTNIVLNSTTEGSSWKLAVSGYRSVRGVTVSDSDARVGLPIPALDSENGGNNENWTFGVAPALWLGASGDSFNTAANWSPAAVPGAATRVLVESANPMTIIGTVSILDLTVGGGEAAASVTVNGALTVGESVVVLDKGTVTWNRPGVVSNDLIVAAGGLMTHTGNSSTEANKLDLTVQGDAAVEVGGVLDVMGKGYAAGEGPGGSVGTGNKSGGSYGGKGGIHVTDFTRPCYGSIVAPTNLGSGGGYVAGGGAILMRIGGRLRHDGSMIADGAKSGSYYSGSGGTVSLFAGELLGIGLVQANGGDYTLTTSPGGGGRVALVVTNASANLSAFTGTVLVRGGLANGVGVPLAGAGTIYRQVGSDKPGRGTVEVENGNATAAVSTDVPPGAYYVPGEVDRAVFYVSNGARLRLTDNFTVGDIWLDNAVLDLGSNTLTVSTRKHDLATGTVTNYGEIIWTGLPPGVMIIVK